MANDQTGFDERSFEDYPDRGRILISGTDTGGAYSVMELIIAPRGVEGGGGHGLFGAHRHAQLEEVFIIRKGSLEFLSGDEVRTLGAGDVARTPAGTRHGFHNSSGQEVDLLVVFSPGGFEQLFVKHSTDRPDAASDGFADDAGRFFATEFES